MDIKSICFLYGNAYTKAKELGHIDAALANDEFVLSSQGRGRILYEATKEEQKQFFHKAYLYLDWWGASKYSIANDAYPDWQPCPGDLSMPEIRSPKGPYCFVIDKFHIQRYVSWVWNTINSPLYSMSKGIFGDDWQSVRWWNLSPEEIEIAWPLQASQGAGFYAEMQHDTEHYIRALCALRNKKVIVNGNNRKWGERLFECYGKWVSKEVIEEHSRPGDAIMVNGLKADRETWAKTYRPQGGYPEGTSFKEVFKDAMELALEYDLRLGISMEESPEDGGSIYSTHKYTDPKTWEKI